MADRDERDQPEGVRILGAEEAQAVLGGEPGRGAAEADDDPEPELDFGAPAEHRPTASTWSAAGSDDEYDEDYDEIDDAEAEAPRAMRPMTPPGGDTGEGPPDELVRAVPVEPAEAPPLPHWTEPATGQVPAVFASDEEESDEDLAAWSAFSGQTRYRSDTADWSAADFENLGGGDDAPRLGALADAPPPDDDEAFAAQVAARRRRGGSRPRVEAPAVAEETELVPAPSGRDLPMALLTAAAMVVVALLAWSYGRTTTLIVAAAVIGLASLELANGLRSRGHHPATLIAFLASVGLTFAAKADGTAAFPVFFGLTTVFSMLWFLWKVTPGRPVRGVASTVLAFGYVGVLGGFAGLLLQSRDGTGLLFGTAICTIGYDVVGYAFGSQFGHTRIAPDVSPNKTVEGTLVGFTASVVLALVVVSRIHPWTKTSDALFLGLLVGVGSVLGDLCESMLKRDLEIKDFGSLLPGHGGVLDRFDGLLFCLPITYYLALHLKFF